MSFFREVEGEAAILIENGVYKQTSLYVRDEQLYAKVGGGFVRLMADGSTTKARCTLNYMSWNGPLFRDNLGRLCTAKATGAKPLAPDRQTALLGSSV
ncbi:MAG: hypothetical protein ACTHLK_13745 [Brucella intermedia]